MALPCVILAGGLGTRMRSFTSDIPKALVPVRGRPFADLQLQRLREGGVSRVIYCIGHLGSALRGHLGDGSGHGLQIDYVDEGEELRGTAGALRLAYDMGLLPPVFHVLYGDSYLTLDLDAVEAAHLRGNLPAQMTVLRNAGRWDRSNVVLGDGMVLRYEPDPAVNHPGMDWIDYGLSTVDRELVAELVPGGTVVQLPGVWNRLSLAGRLGGFEVSHRFYEVGSPSGLRELEEHLAAG